MVFLIWIRLPSAYIFIYLRRVGLFVIFLQYYRLTRESSHTNQGVCIEKKIDLDNNSNY